MRSDIDRLMKDRQLDGLIIVDGEEYSVEREYLTNNAHVDGLLVRKVDGDTVFFVGGMESEEAQKSGLTVVNEATLGFYDLLEQYRDDLAMMTALYWKRCLDYVGLSDGRIGIYGTGQVHVFADVLPILERELPTFDFVGEVNIPTLFDEAYITKDQAEIERLESVAERTNEVVQATWDFIATHRADGDSVVNEEGKALTIGDVKRFVRRALLDQDLEDTGMIFAQGRDAGFPHSRGEENMPLRTGQSIIFDLFPRELGGGYHHDITRTWCIGYAPPAVEETYNQVMEAFDIAVESFGVGRPTHIMQEAVLDYFEQNGHKTTRIDSRILEGYVHSLGHGLGIKVHERPGISHVMRKDVFQKGNCITIEPGLYYPEKGYGVRIEDSCVVTEDGELLSLSPFRKDLVLPLNG